MAAPTSPYCTSAEVALWMKPKLNHQSDFDTDTFPTKANVESIIDLISASIDMELANVGYYVPLVELDDEVWLSFQTSYLQMLCSLGVVSALSDKAMHPAASARIRLNTNLEYNLAYDTELKKLRTGLVPLRASFRRGTLIEKVLSEPQAPDVNLDTPSQYEGLERLTQRIQDFQLRYENLQKEYWIHNEILDA